MTGQVRNSGGYKIPSDETFTVSKAILKAGGFIDFSDKKNVRLVRNTCGEKERKKTFVIIAVLTRKMTLTMHSPLFYPSLLS